MLKKLKNKFIVIILSLLSLCFVVILVSYFYINYSNIILQSHNTLKDLSIRQYNALYNSKINDFNYNSPYENQGYFLVFAKNNFSITSIQSNIPSSTLSESEMVAYARESFLHHGDSDIHYSEDSKFMYLITSHNEIIQITYLATSYQQEQILKLILIIIAVFITSLILFLLIGIIITKMTLKPISDAFILQQRFLQDASHELKTPLTSIIANTEVLINNFPDNKWLLYIREEALRMKSLTEDLLYLAKDDSKNLLLDKQYFNFSQFLEDIVMFQEVILFENNHILNTEIEPDIEVYGDKNRLNQLINILIDNANKYASKDCEIKIKLLQKDDLVIFKISNLVDNFDHNSLEKIFNRFYRVDNARARIQGGSGLGLSIALSIVKNHHGNIYASLDKNKFIITVELQRRHEIKRKPR